MNSTLKSMLDELDIPSKDQDQLQEIHQIVDYESLKAKRSELDGETLDQVDGATQKIVAVALVYLESLRFSDPLPHFSKVGWMDFAIKHANGPIEKETLTEVVSEEDGSMDVDYSGDETGRTMPTRRKSTDDDSKGGAPKKQKTANEDIKIGPFEFIDQGFQPSDMALPAMEGDRDVSSTTKALRLTFVDFNGRRFHKRQCYILKTEKGETVLVGIRSFRSETEANCVMVVHSSKTFLGSGSGDHSDRFNKDMEECKHSSSYVQLRKIEIAHLSDLGPASEEPKYLPNLIYEPQTRKTRQAFAYLWDNDRSNQVKVPRKNIRLVEAFTGAGGMHLGWEQENFETVIAVEWDSAAVETFKHNNPGVPVYQGDVDVFIKKMETDPEYRDSMGRIDVIHASSPCQGFSKANRNSEETESDANNNRLSYSFNDLLRVTDATFGVFENVEGMWSKKGMPYLKKMLVDCIGMGYQIRVMVLRACDYGDPQDRPRFIIFAAKNFARMPNRPHRTHGPGREPYMTVKETLDHLRTPYAKKNYPNMGDHNTSDCKHATDKGDSSNKNATKGQEGKDFVHLEPHGLAPTVLASGPPIFHYAEKGPDGNSRCINVRECAALQSFPFNYEFKGTQTQKYKQAGNAVPVGLASAIARAIKSELRVWYTEELSESDPVAAKEGETILPAQEEKVQDEATQNAENNNKTE